NHPCTMAGPNFLNTSPLHHQSIASYPCKSLISNAHLKNISLDPISFGRPPFVPFITGINQNYSMNIGYRNRTNAKDIMKSKAFGIKVQEHFHKTKKRPVDKANDTMKPMKTPMLMQEDSTAVTGLARENFSSEIWHNRKKNERESDGDKAV